MDIPHGRWLRVWRESLTAIAQECCGLYWTNPGSSISQSSSCRDTYHSSRKPSKLNEQDMRRYLLTAPPYGQVWHKAFFWWDRAQGRSPHAPGVPKNALGPVGIPLVRGASGAGQLTQPSSKGGKSLGGRPPEAEGKYTTHQATPGRIRASSKTCGALLEK